MRNLLAVVSIALLCTANVGMAGDASTGSTHPQADMETDSGTNMPKDGSMSTDGSMSSDGSSATDGRSTGKGKQLNKGKTQTEPVDQGGRIDKR